MPQLSYSSAPVKAYNGAVADEGPKDLISATNSTEQRSNCLVVNAVNAADYSLTVVDGNSETDQAVFTADTQRVNCLVVNAVNAAVYTLDIVDGNAVADSATYTADGSATKQEIVDGLIAAVNLLALDVNAVAIDSDEFYIEAVGAAYGFTVTSNGDTPSDVTTTIIVTKQEIVTGLIAAVNALGLSVAAVAIDSDEFYLEATNQAGGFTATSDGTTPSNLTVTTVVSEDQVIPYGRFVCIDAAQGDKFCRLPRVAADVGGVTLGVAVSHTSSDVDAVGYVDKSTVSIVNKGRVWMIAEDAVSLGDDVYVRYTANGGTKLPGMVRSDGDTSKAAKLNRAKFASSAGAFELVLVELS